MSTWIRSSACTYGNCVEVRHLDGHVEVRDNTAPDDVLYITPADWAAFLVGAKAGEFDGPAADTAPTPDVAALLPVVRAAIAYHESTGPSRGDDAEDELLDRVAELPADIRALLGTDTTPDPS